MSLDEVGMPETFDEFFEDAFGLDRQQVWSSTFFFEFANAAGAVGECQCSNTFIRPSSFVEAINDHYDLDGRQTEQLERALMDCEADVTEGSLCSYHASQLEKDD